MTYAAEQNQSPHAAQATLPLIGPLIGNRHPERPPQSHELADDRVASGGLKVLFERLCTHQQLFGQRRFDGENPPLGRALFPDGAVPNQPVKRSRKLVLRAWVRVRFQPDADAVRLRRLRESAQGFPHQFLA